MFLKFCFKKVLKCVRFYNYAEKLGAHSQLRKSFRPNKVAASLCETFKLEPDS